MVVGVNDDSYDPARHDILTAASCTDNEWGYANRLVELARAVALALPPGPAPAESRAG